MKSAVRVVRQIQILMLVSVVLYVAAGEMVSRTVTHAPANALFHAFSLISISLVAATVVVRRTLLLPSEAALKERSDSSLAWSRWKTGHILLYVLCEMLGLFGLVLRVAGFTLAHVWGFYLGGFVLLLLYSPRAPCAEAGRS
jgi:cytochrome b561